MNHYKFSVVNGRIDECEGQVDGTSAEYELSTIPSELGSVFYKKEFGEIIDIVSESFN